MSTLAGIGISVVNLVLDDFIKLQQQRARDPGWAPGTADKQAFLDQIAQDTPEKIQEEVAAEQGKTWAERQPPKSETPPEAGGA